MLCDFLDSLGIKHDDNGTVDQIPPAEKPALENAVASLLAKYDPAIVAVYLTLSRPSTKPAGPS